MSYVALGCSNRLEELSDTFLQLAIVFFELHR